MKILLPIILLFSTYAIAEQIKPIAMGPASDIDKQVIFKKLGYQIANAKNFDFLVGRADFNDDKIDDLIVVVNSSESCGSGGCATYLIVTGNDPIAYTTNNTFLNETRQFSVGTKLSGGIRTLILMQNGKVIRGEKKGTPLYNKPLEYEFSKFK